MCRTLLLVYCFLQNKQPSFLKLCKVLGEKGGQMWTKLDKVGQMWIEFMSEFIKTLLFSLHRLFNNLSLLFTGLNYGRLFY